MKQTHKFMKRIITLVVLVACCVVGATAAEGATQRAIDATTVATQDIDYKDNAATPTADKDVVTESVNKRLAARGYRGFINITPITRTFINEGVSFNASTTHGYQINERFFVGAGVGLNINLGNEGLGVTIPAYGAFRGNVGKRLAQFTYGARLGAAYADYGNFNSDTSVHNGETVLCYMNVDAGLRLGISRYFAIIITPEVDIFVGKYSIVGVGARLGFEF